MFGIDFQNFSPWLNLGIFACLAITVWYVGTKLAYYSDTIAERTGLGKAFAGMVLLAVATSLPEISTTATAASYGNAPLAAGNLLGGVVMQTAVLAIVDITSVKGALTYFTPRPVLLLEGGMLVLILALIIAGAVTGDVLIFGVGLWTSFIFAVYLIGLYLIKNYERRETWQPVDVPDEKDSGKKNRKEKNKRFENTSTKKLVFYYVIAAAAILASGYSLTRVTETIGEQTGIGATFVGATLLAISTSLPELSTTITAVRLGAYSMAVSNIFGSNAIDAALLFAADAVYQGESLLSVIGRPAIFMATVGIAVTMVYLIGLIERRDRSFFRAGIDSLIVMGIYLASLVGLYYMK